MLVSSWMANKRMKMVQHSPYSPDLAPCDFFLFPCIKHSLGGIRIQSTQELKKALENYQKRTIKGLQRGVPGLGVMHKEVCECERQLF